MALTVEAMVERLKAVEARYPETAVELEPVIQALTGPQAIMVGTETARRLLGLGSVNTVKHWLELGILPGEREEHSGRWRIPLAAVLRFQAQQAALAEAGGEDLTEEELATLSATRPGTAPWQRD